MNIVSKHVCQFALNKMFVLYNNTRLTNNIYVIDHCQMYVGGQMYLRVE